MRGAQAADAGKAAGAVLGEALGVIEHLHLTIARRAFSAVGPGARPVQLMHDGITTAVYGAVTAAHRVAPRVAARVVAAATPGDAAPFDTTRTGNTVFGAVNGLWGDRLAATGNTLGFTMAVRHDHHDVAMTNEHVDAAFPSATPRIAVFVHGLCKSEDGWWPSPRRQTAKGSFCFGERLAGDAGCTPVYVRYNSGLHVSDSGAALDRLLESLVSVWPVPVSEVVLVGHSMGGLVARSACHQGHERGAAWAGAVRHVFCLGTPHLGAPLERGVNAVSSVLRRVPETRALAGILDARSAGIKDLRYGSLLQDDWHGVDPDEFLTDRCNEVPFLPHASHYFVGVTVTRDPHHPLGALVGDLLVQFSSASGKGRRRQIPFDIDKGHHIGGLNHFDLPTHPDVYAQIVRWLTAGS